MTGDNPISVMFTQGNLDRAKPGEKDYIQSTKDEFEFLSKPVLIDADFAHDFEKIERFYGSELVGSEKMDRGLTPALNIIFESDVNYFTFRPYRLSTTERREEDRYKLFLAVAEEAIHIDDFGDGYRHAFSILGPALISKNMPFLIEEIESHQHPGSLKKLIDKLIQTSRDNDLQLFISTHSYDAFRYFYYNYKDQVTRENEFRVFHVIRDANTGIVTTQKENDITKIRGDIFDIDYS